MSLSSLSIVQLLIGTKGYDQHIQCTLTWANIFFEFTYEERRHVRHSMQTCSDAYRLDQTTTEFYERTSDDTKIADRSLPIWEDMNVGCCTKGSALLSLENEGNPHAN
ncbi:hypothetical protein HG530_004522 [Fusarium avenaceum]|nr:hypothetical protein HG530_004522 [Fusarium avenaceum]